MLRMISMMARHTKLHRTMWMIPNYNHTAAQADPNSSHTTDQVDTNPEPLMLMMMMTMMMMTMVISSSVGSQGSANPRPKKALNTD